MAGENGKFKEVRQLLERKVPSSGWHIVGVKDIDLDNKGDIVWQKDDGTLNYWRMNGSDCLGYHSLIPVRAEGNWKAKAVK